MPGYLVKNECIAVAGVADIHIRSLLDRQQFADPLGEAEALGISSATWPLFGLLWPSGLQLAQYMANRPLRSGERVLEIGCGLALASLIVHRQGVDVTASDCHPMASTFLKKNLILNALPPMPYTLGNWSQLAPSGIDGRFDLIMGSDVLYERDDDGILPLFIEHHAHATAEVLIIDPDRGNRPAFSRRMQAMGFDLIQTTLSALPDGIAYKGRLLHYKRVGLN
ncbi:MAG: SAM-dependent methyltransferase [Aquabacterium sp.]|nr:SAM-dependent methyltransferase [Aquabacterium sp.]